MLKESKTKVQSFEDRKYKQKEDMNSCLVQAFSDLKHDMNQHGWTKLVEELNGVTLRRFGTDMFEMSYHKIYTGSPQDIDNHDRESKKFLDSVMGDLKKRFKKLSGKTLGLKKVKENRTIEKYSRLYAESVPLFAGNTVYGGTVGRYYCVFSRVMKIESPDPQAGEPGKLPVWG